MLAFSKLIGALSLLLSTHGATVMAQDREPEPPKLHFEQLGNSVPRGSDVAIIERSHGHASTFRILKLGANGLDVELSPIRDDAARTAVFFVVGLGSLAQFEEFLEHPERWHWTQFRGSIEAGQIRPWRSRFVPPGDAPMFRGRVLDVQGQPLRSFGLRVWAAQDSESLRETRTPFDWGYDPVTGRFWASQPSTATKLDARSRFLLDLLPHSEFGCSEPRELVARLRYPWRRDAEETVLLPRAGTVRAPVVGLSNARIVRYEMTLSPEAGTHRALRTKTASISGSECTEFDDLLAGSYALDVHMAGSDRSLHRQSGIAVAAGQTVELAPIDLRDQLRSIRVRVTDPNGKPVNALVEHVRAGRASLAWSGRKTGKTGIATVVVPKSGASLLVAARFFGSRLFTDVHQDLDVQLESPHEITVRVDETQKIDSEILENLYVVASPSSVSPAWAPRLFTQHEYCHNRFSKLRRTVWTNVTRLSKTEPRVMDIPCTGAWHFALVYSPSPNFSDTRTIPLPFRQSIRIDQSRELTIELPVTKLQRVVREQAHRKDEPR
ncbi:MAG: hypothetical protein KDC95_05200 [Planctomycetes bacterium]|nr:hypothetical protein [Planctomycetota bacterium]